MEEIHRQLAIEKAYLATLRHPNIIRLIGSGRRGLTNDLEPFLVLEYLEENTLTHLISKQRRGRLDMPPFVDGKKNYIPWPQAMEWARVRESRASTRCTYCSRDWWLSVIRVSMSCMLLRLLFSFVGVIAIVVVIVVGGFRAWVHPAAVLS